MLVAEMVTVRSWGSLLVVVSWAAACSVNPVPEPPAQPEPEIEGPITSTSCGSCDGRIRLSGKALNATQIWIVNLDTPEPPVVGDVAADGTFALDVDASVGDELRIQARDAEQRSDPIDLVAAAQGTLSPAPRPLASCLTAVLELDLGEVGLNAPASSRTLSVQNDCAEPVSVASVALRAPAPDFTSSQPPVPLVIEPGSALAIDVTFDPSAIGLGEEILLVEIQSPQVDRRAVTLYGRGRP